MPGDMDRRGGLLCVLGTRPEAIKLAPVVLELRRRGAGVTVCLTGQHPAMARDSLADLGLVADVDLAVRRPGQAVEGFVAAALPPLAHLLARVAPAQVMVQGDTASALAGALAATYARAPLAHVEAGLRSGAVEPFPEDMHRRVIAQLATLHFAPTDHARTLLLREGIADAVVHVTGNPVIDALRLAAARLAADAPLRERLAAALPPLGRDLILVTAHRRENVGAPMAGIADAVARIAAGHDLDIVVPVHPNPRAGAVLEARLGSLPNVRLLPPLDYLSFVMLLGRARLVLTDSGGIQEEAPAFGCPVLVLRTATERPEGIAAGAARLIGTDPAAIVAAVADLLARPACDRAMPVLPYGDGRAAQRIAAIVAPMLAARTPVPTPAPPP